MGRHNTVAGRMAQSADARGRLFTKLTREITIAARSGSDVGMNAALRSAVNKAKDNSVPKDTIERAIKKGAGELKGAAYESIVYEGYGPGGSAILVSALTDNRNRTYPEIRQIFAKNGGNLGEMGVVSWMFQKKGIFVFDAKRFPEEKIIETAVEAGGDDFFTEEGYVTVYCPFTQFSELRESFVAAQFSFEKAGIEYVADSPVLLSDDDLKMAVQLIDKLEEHDDVQDVYANFS